MSPFTAAPDGRLMIRTLAREAEEVAESSHTAHTHVIVAVSERSELKHQRYHEDRRFKDLTLGGYLLLESSRTYGSQKAIISFAIT